MTLGSTPSQTVGPFLHIALDWPDGPTVVDADTPGAVRITGRLLDGSGAPVTDGLVEIWGADPDGHFDHPDDPRRPGGPGVGGSGAGGSGAGGGGFGAGGRSGRFRGFGRCATDGSGAFWFRTLEPGPLPAGDGATEAPHLDVSIFARGLLDRLVTRMYLPDHPANAADPVLSGLSAADRARLTATRLADGSLRFDIHLQGPAETPFFLL